MSAPTPQRTIFITGCSDGSLGAHLVVAFRDAGWRVFATARNLSKLRSAEATGIETLQLDTLSDESIADAVSKVSTLTGGSLDMLINNAGAGYSMPVMDLDLAKARELFDLNFFSLISTTRAFLPLLRASATTHGGVRGGMVVNNTSCSSLTPGVMPFSGAYNASKAAATNLTEAMRLELAPFGIKVINLMTGSVRSTFHANAVHDALPDSSLYNVAKEVVERAMSGVDSTAEGADPVTWATRVARTLSKESPPHWVYCGKYSTMVRVADLLPVGTTDFIIEPKVGLDKLKQKLRKET
jgi:NAD(P)-dependent dehydrogenase (short-subunit alcohol dehydrogenase family)